VSVADDCFDYDEVCEVAFGLINDRLFVCVYADWDAERRVISLRKANRGGAGINGSVDVFYGTANNGSAIVGGGFTLGVGAGGGASTTVTTTTVNRF
jgi:hypothetical protein